MTTNPGAISAPNYTQLPNEILDTMSEMGDAELRVVLAIGRKTFGWHKQQDTLSLSQLEDLTGLSRQGVLNGIEAAMRRGVVGRSPAARNGFIYFLCVDGSRMTSQRTRPVNTDQSTPLTSEKDDQSTPLTRSSQPSGPDLVNAVDTQKKGKKKKEIPPPPTPAITELNAASSAGGGDDETLCSEQDEVDKNTSEAKPGSMPKAGASPPNSAPPPSPETETEAILREAGVSRLSRQMLRDLDPAYVQRVVAEKTAQGTQPGGIVLYLKDNPRPPGSSIRAAPPGETEEERIARVTEQIRKTKVSYHGGRLG